MPFDRLRVGGMLSLSVFICEICGFMIFLGFLSVGRVFWRRDAGLGEGEEEEDAGWWMRVVD